MQSYTDLNTNPQNVRETLLTQAAAIANTIKPIPKIISIERSPRVLTSILAFQEITFNFEGEPSTRASTNRVTLRVNYKDGITPDYKLLSKIAIEIKQIKDISMNLKATCKQVSHYIAGSLINEVEQIGIISGSSLSPVWSRIKYPVHSVGYLKKGEFHIAIDATSPIHTNSNIDNLRSDKVEAEIFITHSAQELVHDIKAFCPGGNWEKPQQIYQGTYNDLQKLRHELIKDPKIPDTIYLRETIKESDIKDLSKYLKARFKEQPDFTVQEIPTSEHSVLFYAQFYAPDGQNRFLTTLSSTLKLENGESIRIAETVPRYAVEHLLPLIKGSVNTKEEAIKILSQRTDIPLKSFIFFQTLLLKTLDQA